MPQGSQGWSWPADPLAQAGGGSSYVSAASYPLLPLDPLRFDNGLPAGWSEQADTDGLFSEVFRMARLVHDVNACAMPGINIKYDSFMSIMRHAWSTGWVTTENAQFVARGLRYGFCCGVQRSLLRGVRTFKN